MPALWREWGPTSGFLVVPAAAAAPDWWISVLWHPPCSPLPPPAHLHHPAYPTLLEPRHCDEEFNNLDIDIVSGLREGFPHFIWPHIQILKVFKYHALITLFVSKLRNPSVMTIDDWSCINQDNCTPATSSSFSWWKHVHCGISKYLFYGWLSRYLRISSLHLR